MENIDQQTLEKALSALDEAEKMEQQGAWDKALYKYDTALNEFSKTGLPPQKSREITDKIIDRISEINQFLQTQKSQQQDSGVSEAERANQEQIGIAALDEGNLLVERGQYTEAMEKYLIAAQSLMQAGWGEKELMLIQKEVEKVQKLMSGDTSASQTTDDEYISPGMSQPDVVYSGGKSYSTQPSGAGSNEEYVPTFLMNEANVQKTGTQSFGQGFGDAQQIFSSNTGQQQYDPNQAYSMGTQTPQQQEEYVPTFLQTQQNIQIQQPTSGSFDSQASQIFGDPANIFKNEIYQPQIYQPVQQPQEYVPTFLQSGQSDITNNQNFFLQSQPQPMNANYYSPMYTQTGQQDYMPFQPQAQQTTGSGPTFEQAGQQDYVPYQDQTAKPMVADRP